MKVDQSVLNIQFLLSAYVEHASLLQNNLKTVITWHFNIMEYYRKVGQSRLKLNTSSYPNKVY